MSNDKSLSQAREQADEYDSFTASATVVARRTGEKFTVTNPNLFDYDQLLAYQKLHHLINKCDRWPDVEVPEQRIVSKNRDGTEVESFRGSYVQRGDWIEPYQLNGEMIEPTYEVQVCQIVFGEKEAQRFFDGGGSPLEVVRALSELRRRTEDRAAADPKSDAGADVLEEPAETDS